jgi:hypothetical protein
VLFRKDTLERIAAGEVTVAFRRWKRPTVKAGGTLQTAVGMLAIEAVEPLKSDSAITKKDARAAGFASADEIAQAFPPVLGRTLYRVVFRLAGPDPRIALRAQTEMSEDERDSIAKRLAGYDARSPIGPWTGQTLDAIAERPATRAGDLAADLGQERLPFKANVRKLKALGLTESLEIGYRLSPRGLAYLGIETEAANGRWSEPAEPPNTEARETPTPGETST